jgi:hypothetical protein
MSGSSTSPSASDGYAGNPGVYGILGLPAAGNVPGGHSGASSWTDHSGHLWLFGGVGYDANGVSGFLNDLWEFDPPANKWTWMGGSSTLPSPYQGNSGVYGTLGVPSAGNVPGSHGYASNWTDGSGNLWIFGGMGNAASGGGYLNDLWEFQPSAPVTPGFSLSASPDSLIVAPGASATSTVTVTPSGGFTGSVMLSASGLPSGVTASFSPNPATGTSVLTLTVGASAVPGSYSPAITGTSATLTANAGVPLTIRPVSTKTTTTLSSDINPSILEQLVTLTAAVSSSSATGTVNLVMSSGEVLVTLNLVGGLAKLGIPNLPVGANSIIAVYSGDTYYSPSSSKPYTQTVNRVPSSVTLVSSANPSAAGQQVTFTASVDPSYASGRVQILDGKTSLGTATITSGSAVLTISTLTVGTHSITAVYSGDAYCQPATSAAFSQTVNKPSSSVTLSSSANPSAPGQSVTFTAKVTPAAATGTVQFFDGKTSLGTATLASGSAALTISTLTSGTHSIAAVYSGAANYAGSTSAALSQAVLPAAPTKLTATAASSSQIDLTWTASPTSGVTYNVYSSTNSGFTPSAANRIASGLTATSYSNTGLSPSTTHYYLVTAQNSAGESAASNQASATTTAALSCHNAD